MLLRSFFPSRVGFLVLLFVFTFTSASSALDDKEILLQSKAEIIGSCTDCLPSWRSNNSLDDFEGITTTTTTTTTSASVLRVLSINLYKLTKPVRGILPPSWALLTAVKSIDVSQNMFITGSLPEEWSALIQLTFFSVSSNSIAGSIPSSYSALTKLKHFSTGNNNFNGTLPPSFKTFKMLENFDVSFNFLSGTLPDEYSEWKNITKFGVNDNLFVGELPAGYSAWTQIVEFYCGDNRLTGELPMSYESWGPSVLAFVIGNNHFSGTLPPGYSSWVNLQFFYASFAGLSGPLPEEYKSWSQLNGFNVARNQLTGNLPAVYQNWTQISSFSVNENLLTGPLPPEYSAWSNIGSFLVTSNRLTGQLPSSYSNWNTTLNTFFINENFFEGSIPASYAHLTQMNELDVSNNNLSGNLPSYFGTAWQSTLQVLQVNNNQFTGELPLSFGGLAQLTVLDVSNNLLEGTITSVFCGLDQLFFSDFSKNCLTMTSEAIDCFAAFPNLVSLEYTPSCFSVLPAIPSAAPLSTSYSYNVVNKHAKNISDCEGTIQGLYAVCPVEDSADIRFVNGKDKVFHFAIFCNGLAFVVSFQTACYALLFRPVLQCFLDKEATIPCSTNQAIDYLNPPYHNKTILADVSYNNDESKFDASNFKYIYGVYFRVLALASVNLVANFTTPDGKPGPLRYAVNTTTSMFQADLCQLQSSVAIQYSTDCSVCPSLALCDGTTSIFVSDQTASWRYSSELLPFYECDLKTTRGCLKSGNNNNNKEQKYDGSGCREHFTGFLCARCESDFAMIEGECSECPSEGSIVAIFSCCIIVLLVLATLLVYVSLDSAVKMKEHDARKEDEKEKCCDCDSECNCCHDCLDYIQQKLHQYRPQLEKLTVITRFLINHFTLIGALNSTSAAKHASDSLKKLLSVQNGAGGGALLGAYSGTLSCLFSNKNQISSSVLNFNILWSVFACVFAFESIFFFAFTRKLTSTAAVALFLSFVAFSPLAEYSSKLLALCKPFDFYITREYLLHGADNAKANITFKYLSTDLAQECDSDFENSARVGAALTISLFCGLLPAIIAFSYKKLCKDQDTRQAIFNFMTENYKNEAWFYELIVMVRKLLIALVISIFVDHVDLQLQLFTLITTMMLVASLTIRPLQSKTANIVDQVSISSALVCATFLSAISGFENSEGVAVTSTLLIFITQAVAIFAIVVYSHRNEKDDEEKYRQEEEEEVGSLEAPLFSAGVNNDDSELGTEYGYDDDGENHLSIRDKKLLSYWKQKAAELGETKMDLENQNQKLHLDKENAVSEKNNLEEENHLLRKKLSELEAQRAQYFSNTN